MHSNRATLIFSFLSLHYFGCLSSVAKYFKYIFIILFVFIDISKYIYKYIYIYVCVYECECVKIKVL